MTVSFIAPIRGRTAGLLRMINSIVMTLPKLDDAEILLKIDDDDIQVLNFVQTLQDPKIRIHTIIGPRGEGYADLHKFVNQLCQESWGRWLWLFNDDVELIVPPLWYDTLRSLHPHREIGVVHHRTTNVRANGREEEATANLFPIITRRMFDVMGHFSLSAHNDTYINYITERVPEILIRRDDIHLKHYLEEQMETRDMTMGNKTWTRFNSPEIQDAILADVEKLKQALA